MPPLDAARDYARPRERQLWVSARGAAGLPSAIRPPGRGWRSPRNRARAGRYKRVGRLHTSLGW
eukprot:11163003-Lingulodinium_polyedra.AAC.1